MELRHLIPVRAANRNTKEPGLEYKTLHSISLYSNISKLY